MKKFLAIVFVGLMALVGCSDSSTEEPSSEPAGNTAAPIPSKPASNAYGSTAKITDGTGAVVEITVEKPTTKEFHQADYDEACTVEPASCSKPGKSLGKFAVVVVRYEVVSGTVDIGSQYGTRFQLADGTVTSESLPIMQFEDTDPISNHPTNDLTAGQKTSGEIYFQGQAEGGKVIITPAGSETPVVWK